MWYGLGLACTNHLSVLRPHCTPGAFAKSVFDKFVAVDGSKALPIDDQVRETHVRHNCGVSVLHAAQHCTRLTCRRLLCFVDEGRDRMPYEHQDSTVSCRVFRAKLLTVRCLPLALYRSERISNEPSPKRKVALSHVIPLITPRGTPCTCCSIRTSLTIYKANNTTSKQTLPTLRCSGAAIGLDIQQRCYCS